jgi:hypothetical protein
VGTPRERGMNETHEVPSGALASPATSGNRSSSRGQAGCEVDTQPPGNTTRRHTTERVETPTEKAQRLAAGAPIDRVVETFRTPLRPAETKTAYIAQD